MKTMLKTVLISAVTSAITSTIIGLLFCAQLRGDFLVPLQRLMVLEGFRSADPDGRLPRWSEVHVSPANGDMQGNGIAGLTGGGDSLPPQDPPTQDSHPLPPNYYHR